MSVEFLEWRVELIMETENTVRYKSINSDCEELRKILSSTTKTMSSTLNSLLPKLPAGGEAIEV